MMYDWGGGGPGFGMILGPLFLLAVVAIAAWIVAAIFRSSGFGALPGGPSKTGPGNSALAILQERFARGELDKAQYEDMRKTLASS